MTSDGSGQAVMRTTNLRLYPGAHVRLNVAWIAAERRFPQGSAGFIRGWGHDNRPQVEFDSDPGLFVSVSEDALRAV